MGRNLSRYIVFGRLFFYTVLFVFLLAHLLSVYVVAQIPDSSQGSIKELEHRLSHQEEEIKSLDLQKRLTTLENASIALNHSTEKILAWQEKIQWTLLGLLFEAVVRLYGQYRTHKSSR